ncbi:MAG: LamG domain-containing protein [Patescibacteria group bacterium]|nr:LamG domain-containing protein [Patescibacteria group bacterium]MDD5164522.1 LamG domain-containing protein [Patescibacteria group bacterium]MDD5534736.1 LamG domain-containing protein [Patescibacteria group bacterium]
MTIKFSIKNRLIISGIFIILGFLILLAHNLNLKIFSAKADSEDNIRGWGWSENIGWVSANCYNDYGKCVGGSNNGLYCDNGCPGGTCQVDGIFEDRCSGNNYGVAVDTISPYKLHGYAWSSNMGWICFGCSCDNNSSCCDTPSSCEGPDAWDGNKPWACSGNATCVGGTCSCLGDKGESFYPTPTSDELRAHWNLNNESSPIQDSSGNGNVGTLNGTTRVSGKWGNARSFNGTSDYIEMADSPSLSITGDLTVEAFIKRGVIGGTEQQTILGKWDDGTGKSYRLWLDTDNKLNFFVSGTTEATITQTTANLTDITKWHSVAGKYDYDGSEKLSIFVDGVEVDGTTSGTVPSTLIDLSQKFYLGAKKGASTMDTFFKGTIENVSIWFKAKSDSEIFSDGQMELSGWAKVINLGDNGWMKLQKSLTDATPSKWWGSYLEDYIDFYRMGGWGWNDYSSSLLGVGWLENGYPKDVLAPATFDILSVDNSTDCHQLSVLYSSADWAENYTYWRKDDVESCPTCSTEENCGTNGYTQNSVSEGTEGYLQDTGLIEDTGYCYAVVAHNATGSTWNSNGAQWGKTLNCEPDGETTDAKTCGQIKTKWDGPQGSSADGYNIYRTLTDTGCNSLVDSRCQLVGHLAEGISYNGLIAQWKMNETSWSGQSDEVKDSSSQDNNGTAGNGVSTVSGAKFNYGGSFAGDNDYVEVSDADDLDLSTAITLEAWVKIDTSKDNGIIAKGTSSNLRNYEMRVNSSGYLSFNFYTGDWKNHTDDTTIISPNQWYHLASVFDDSSDKEVTLYVNGVKVKEFDETALLTANNETLTIGRVGSYYFDGLLDNVAIYNVAKSDSDIKIDYEAGTSNCSLEGDCGLASVCDGAEAPYTKCGTADTCCYIDKRVIPKMNYYYVINATSEQGVSPSSDQTPAAQTSCWPTHQQQEQ